MKASKSRNLKFAAIAIAVIVLLTLALAPSRDRLSSGSTYSRSPDGYGAWYGYMEQRGTPIQRWQRPLSALKNYSTPITLLRVQGNVPRSQFNLDDEVEPWIEQGHTIVTLGVWQLVTAAPFSSEIDSPQGTVKIETRRRAEKSANSELLGDRFGAVVWQETRGKGRAIWATTPYLAANAYQNEPGNYAFLAQLLTETDQPIWVDEYIHGYRDSDSPNAPNAQDEGYRDSHPPNAQEAETSVRSWWQYLAQTPLLVIGIQGGIILLLAIAAQNIRFGQAEAIDPPEVNNSETYIKALASVLRKAQSSAFAIETVGKAEQLALQERLGLGSTLLEPEELLAAWQAQTGRDAAELKLLLPSHRMQNHRKWRSLSERISERNLRLWLQKWQQERRF